MSETTMYYLGTGTEFIKAQCKPYKTIEGALKAAAKDESLVVWDENGNVIGSLTDNVPDGALATNADGSVNSYNADGQQVGVATAATVAAVTGNEPQGDTEGENASQGTDEPTNEENGENEANAQPQSTGGENMMQQGDAETVENGTENTEQANTQPDAGEDENGANAQPQSTGGEDVQQGNEPERVKEQTGRFNITVVCEGSLRLRRSASFTIDNECGRASKGQTYIGKRIFMCDGLPMVETIDGLFLSAAACHVSIEKVG